MIWKELSELLYDERKRLFGSLPDGRSISWFLSHIRENLTAEEANCRESVDAAVRQYSRNRELPENLTIEERRCVQARFDWAIALTTLLWMSAEFNHVRMVAEPTAGDEDLIEWALIATWHVESWSLDKTAIDVLHRRISKSEE